MTRTAPARLALLSSLALLSGCHGQGAKVSLPQDQSAARAVRVGKPATRLETGLARATGPIRAREEATLGAKLTGQVARVRVQVGDRVRAGQPLVELDSGTFAIAVENARAAVKLGEANLAAAERELKRAQALAAEQAMAEAGLDRARTAQELAAAQLDQARAGLRMAERTLADTVIVAPFDGVVTAKLVNPGDSVTAVPNTPVARVTGVDRLEARLAVPEGVEPFVAVGQKVAGVTTPGGVRFEGTVRVKNAVVDAASRTVEVLVDVVPPRGALLRPGTLVNVDFGGFGDKDGLYVPSNAVQADGQGSYVFVIAGGKAERRAIKPVQVNPGVVAVEGGLTAGTAVILDPGTLAAGDAVVALAD
jgi:RND family efflux transporter MFP subunit